MMRSVKLRKGLHIDGESLLCINGCGFYGNPLWSGYCSICYKERKQAISSITKRLDNHNKSTTEGLNVSENVSLSHSGSESPSPLAKFEKFEEKKRQQIEKRSKTLKSIFKKASFRENVTTSVAAAAVGGKKFAIPSFATPSALGFSSKQGGFNYDTLSLSGGNDEPDQKQLNELMSDIKKQAQKFGSKMHKSSQSNSIEELSDQVQDFYNFMAVRFEQEPLYTGLSLTSEQIDQLCDFTEKQLLSRLHNLFFTRIQTEDEENDLKMQKRIKSLNWITVQHLEAEIDFQNPKVQTLYDRATSDLIELGSKQVPLEKLDCIVNCSQTILNLLKISRNEVASADQFLPALVYVLIKANPPLLHSNIKYITRFAKPSRLHSGESGYFFTNLCCAVTFIENLNGESLNLSEEVFNQYVNGEAVPPGGFDETVLLSEPLRIMYANQASLNELVERKNKMDLDLSTANNELQSLHENSINHLKPLLQNGVKVPPYQVDENIDLKLIPSALRGKIEEQRRQKEQTLIDLDDKPESSSFSFPVNGFTSSNMAMGFDDNFIDHNPIQALTNQLVELKTESGVLHEPLIPEVIRK